MFKSAGYCLILCSLFHIWQYFSHRSSSTLRLCLFFTFCEWKNACVVHTWILECQTMRVQPSLACGWPHVVLVVRSSDPLTLPLSGTIDILFNAAEFQPRKSAWNQIFECSWIAAHKSPTKDGSIVTKSLNWISFWAWAPLLVARHN